MNESEIQKIVRQELAKQLSVILSGSSANAKSQTEDIEQMYPGMPSILQRPVMHPYGFVSKALRGAIQVTAKQGNTPENRIILGHRDSQRPDDFVPGACILYNQFGQQIRLESGTIKLGGPASAENIVLGQQLKALLQILIAAIATIGDSADAIGSAVSTLAPFVATIPGLGPGDILAIIAAGTDASGAASDAADAGSEATSAGATFVENDAILSAESFARKGA